MNDIRILNRPDNCDVRVIIDEDGLMWHCARDIANGAKLRDSYPLLHLVGSSNKRIFRDPSLSKKGHLYFVNSEGLREIKKRCRSSSAKDIVNWLCGLRELPPKNLASPSAGAAADAAADAEPDTRGVDRDYVGRLLEELAKAKEKISDLRHEISALGLEIKNQRRHVAYAKAVETSDKFILIGDLAKIISQNGREIGKMKLFGWMRENGYLCSGRTYWNTPTQRSLELGLMVMKSSYIRLPTGRTIATHTARVTGKGQIYFVDKLINGQEAKEA